MPNSNPIDGLTPTRFTTNLFTPPFGPLPPPHFGNEGLHKPHGCRFLWYIRSPIVSAWCIFRVLFASEASFLLLCALYTRDPQSRFPRLQYTTIYSCHLSCSTTPASQNRSPVTSIDFLTPCTRPHASYSVQFFHHLELHIPLSLCKLTSQCC